MYRKIGELQLRLSERKECLYCGATLPATKKEHIFNSCWGGSFSTNKLICGKCNEYFSQTIDSELTTYTKFVMNSWGIKGERHKQIPEIVTDECEYNIRAYAKPKLKQKIAV
ncbi:HNH endonuclease [Nostoc sp.]